MITKTLSTFPPLTTERLTLRQPLERDAQQLLLLRSDAMVNKYLDRQRSETVEDAFGFIKKVNENFGNGLGLYWAITQRNDEKLIGTICLFNFSDEYKTCEIGYELLPGYQGQGLMSEALQKVIEFTFEVRGLETIDAYTHKDNQSSTRLLQKSGFAKTAVNDGNNPNLVLFRLSK